MRPLLRIAQANGIRENDRSGVQRGATAATAGDRTQREQRWRLSFLTIDSLQNNLHAYGCNNSARIVALFKGAQPPRQKIIHTATFARNLERLAAALGRSR